MPELPPELRSRVYPEHMKKRVDERNARAVAAGRNPTATTASSTASGLAKLWHSTFEVSSNSEAPPITLDKHLTREFWKRPESSSPLYGMAEYEQQHLKSWGTYVNEYLDRERKLRGERGEGTEIDENDPYWEKYREVRAYQCTLPPSSLLARAHAAPSAA